VLALAAEEIAAPVVTTVEDVLRVVEGQAPLAGVTRQQDRGLQALHIRLETVNAQI